MASVSTSVCTGGRVERNAIAVAATAIVAAVVEQGQRRDDGRLIGGHERASETVGQQSHADTVRLWPVSRKWNMEHEGGTNGRWSRSDLSDQLPSDRRRTGLRRVRRSSTVLVARPDVPLFGRR